MRGTLKYLLLVALLACAGKPEPTPAPRPSSSSPAASRAGVVMPWGWEARVQLDRSDSIVLTLPGGATQVQRMGRRASFSLTVSQRGAVTLRLDSLSMTPAPGSSSIPMVGSVWTGQLSASGVDWKTTAGSGPVIEDLTGDVQGFFPRIPAGGVYSGLKWVDTSTTKGRIDIFEATQRSETNWSTGGDTSILGAPVIPVRASSQLEQSGTGWEGSQKMTMTGQGSRSTTYYLLKTGRVDRVTGRDSISVLIGIPASHQIVPTVRYIRSQVIFSPIRRDGRP